MLIRECTADDVEPLEQLSPSGLNREHARRLERQTSRCRDLPARVVRRSVGRPRRSAMAGVHGRGRCTRDVLTLTARRSTGWASGPNFEGAGSAPPLIGAAEDRARQRRLRWIVDQHQRGQRWRCVPVQAAGLRREDAVPRRMELPRRCRNQARRRQPGNLHGEGPPWLSGPPVAARRARGRRPGATCKGGHSVSGALIRIETAIRQSANLAGVR